MRGEGCGFGRGREREREREREGGKVVLRTSKVSVGGGLLFQLKGRGGGGDRDGE